MGRRTARGAATARLTWRARRSAAAGAQRNAWRVSPLGSGCSAANATVAASKAACPSHCAGRQRPRSWRRVAHAAWCCLRSALASHEVRACSRPRGCAQGGGKWGALQLGLRWASARAARAAAGPHTRAMRVPERCRAPRFLLGWFRTSCLPLVPATPHDDALQRRAPRAAPSRRRPWPRTRCSSWWIRPSRCQRATHRSRCAPSQGTLGRARKGASTCRCSRATPRAGREPLAPAGSRCRAAAAVAGGQGGARDGSHHKERA